MTAQSASLVWFGRTLMDALLGIITNAVQAGMSSYSTGRNFDALDCRAFIKPLEAMKGTCDKLFMKAPSKHSTPSLSTVGQPFHVNSAKDR